MLEHEVRQIIINEFMKNELYYLISENNINDLIRQLKRNMKDKYYNNEILKNEIKEIAEIIRNEINITAAAE